MQRIDTPICDTAERCYPEYDAGLFVEHLQRYEYVKGFAHNKIILDFGCGSNWLQTRSASRIWNGKGLLRLAAEFER